jgi:hypothetical protein
LWSSLKGGFARCNDKRLAALRRQPLFLGLRVTSGI